MVKFITLFPSPLCKLGLQQILDSSYSKKFAKLRPILLISQISHPCYRDNVTQPAQMN